MSGTTIPCIPGQRGVMPCKDLENKNSSPPPGRIQAMHPFHATATVPIIWTTRDYRCRICIPNPNPEVTPAVGGGGMAYMRPREGMQLFRRRPDTKHAPRHDSHDNTCAAVRSHYVINARLMKPAAQVVGLYAAVYYSCVLAL